MQPIIKRPLLLCRAALSACLVLLLNAVSAVAATITVNSTADPAGSNYLITIPQLGATVTLRDALNAARNSGGTNTITFDPSLAGKTIYLLQPANAGATFAINLLPSVAANITIQGLTGNNGVTIARDPNAGSIALIACASSNLILTVNDLTFTGGHTNSSGGAFYIAGGANVSLNRCALTGNYAFYLGGAIYVQDDPSSLTVTNCTIAGNTATNQGGGIYHASGGTVTLVNTTLTNNGFIAYFDYAGYDLLVNTIVSGNYAEFAGNNPDISGNGGFANISSSSHHNLIGNGSGVGGISNGVNGNIVGANPLLKSLGNYGGPTQTVPLSAGSPALDAAAAGIVSTDQRGISRPQGAGADIGAFELVAGEPTTFTNANSTTFITGFNGSFQVSADGTPSPSFSVTGALPAGVTFTAAGLFSGTPASGTEGVYPLTITASNSAGFTTQSFTLTIVDSARAIVVTTTVDEDNGTIDPSQGTGTSLREAINYANGQSLPQTIVFAPSLAGQTFNLTMSVSPGIAFVVNGNITIQGLTGNSGITIQRATSGDLLPFQVDSVGTLTLNDLTVANGQYSYGGGGILNQGTLQMNRCTLQNNYSGTSGGGLCNSGGAAALTNCTIANNHAQNYGGGIFDAGSSLTLTNVTITGNTASGGSGGGLQCNFDSAAVLINTIVAGNTNAGSPSDVSGYTNINASSHHNLIGTGGSGGLVNGVNNNIVGVQNPHLGPLASNGGPTQTVALLGAPAPNAGAVVAGVTTDQRGVARPQYGVPDIGAYEFNDSLNESLVVTTTVDELDFTSDPHFGTGTSLREALAYAQSLGGAQTITFDPSLAGQTINLTMANGSSDGWDSSSALSVTGNITINGLTTPTGVTLGIGTGAALRHFVVRSGASLTLNNLTVTGGNPQLANFNRGGAISAFGNLTALNCTFTGNSSPSEGGAIQNWAGATNLVLQNCTFSGNSAGNQGGAFSANGTQATLSCLTITNNSAPNSAIVLWGTLGTMVDSILAGNSNDTVLTGNSGTFTAQSANNLLGASSATGLTNGNNGNQLSVPVASLLLGSLANNGGPTPTIALQPGSLAVDAGVAIAGLTTDQRGVARPQGNAVDIGAFELVPSVAAAIPIVSPFGSTYQNNVQVSITSTSADTAVRYTLDGSTPSATNGLLYTGPFNLSQTATVNAIAYNGGWLPSPIASAGFTVLSPLPYWRNLQGLPANGSQDLATPAGDGVANLLKYAFNMAPNAGDLARANVQVLAANGVAGLPTFGIDAQGRLVMEFVRRKASNNPGVAYIVETGSDLNSLMELSLAGASIVSIDSTWERVTVTDPTVSTKRFGHLRIQPLGVYFNNFNAGLGAATLRGDAIYTNQAVQVTDTAQGQSGAVTFDGINLVPEVTGFTAQFNLQLGPTTTGIPADGGSFAVGDLGTAAWGEGGPITTHNIAVGFDTYDNGTVQSGIGIHLWVNGVDVADNATNPYTNGQLVPVVISYDAATGLTLTFNGAVIFSNVAVGGFTFQATDKFGFGARTGAADERCVVDDVQIAPR